ncbi:MAG TPA: hypothetical protein VJ874_04375 [Candidatus Thermoplasmatota archaeon]|nr:hypothetical protein [Candidatus Thermoplasmatota archaeon]
MRALAFLLALLLLLVPLGASQGSEGSGSASSSDSSSSGPRGDTRDGRNETDGNETDGSDDGAGDPDGSSGPGTDGCPMPEEGPDTPEETEACRERFCREHPRAESCRSDDGAEDDEADRGPSEWRRWCRTEAEDDEQRDRCRQELAEYGAERDGRWISFRVDAANASLLDYRVDGLLVAESIHLETGSENLTVRSSGSALRIGDEDTELVLHDNPTGLLRLKADDGSLTILLPGDSEVQASEDGSIARIGYAGGGIGHLRADNATFLDERTVLASGFLALLVPEGREERKEADDDAGEDGGDDGESQRVTDAIEHRRVGAEITLRHGRSAAAISGAAGNDSIEVLAYDDVEVQVQMPAGDTATPEAPIRIEVSAELDEGRTIVLNVERALLESADPSSLVLRYFDLHEQLDGSVLETEVVFRAASGLQDVLDPTDDSGSPEYWVVEDANGLQVLASVPHWSAHAITMGSLAKLAGPDVMAGLAIGVAGSVLAAGVLFWPRRPEDE